MDVTYFQPQRPGPEIIIENAVAQQVPRLFPAGSKSIWTGGSLTIGAGKPDLVVVSFEPEVFALAHKEMPTPQILAYLRAVRRARLSTITGRFRDSPETIIRCLDGLIQAQAISAKSDTFYISPVWREILPEIVTIEAKVSNWRKAIEQARRNRIFAHKSFVALPDRVAKRVRDEKIWAELGLGLLSVNETNVVTVLRRPRRSQPRVWTYYYELAFIIASHNLRSTNAVCNTDGGRPD